MEKENKTGQLVEQHNQGRLSKGGAQRLEDAAERIDPSHKRINRKLPIG